MSARRIRNRPEQNLQIQVMQFLELALPKDAVAFHVPNAARRSVVEGAMNKRAGVKAGIPDIVIIYGTRAHFIELKSKGGSLSLAQCEMSNRLLDAGALWGVAFSVEAVAAFIRAWGIPSRIKSPRPSPPVLVGDAA